MSRPCHRDLVGLRGRRQLGALWGCGVCAWAGIPGDPIAPLQSPSPQHLQLYPLHRRNFLVGPFSFVTTSTRRFSPVLFLLTRGGHFTKLFSPSAGSHRSLAPSPSFSSPPLRLQHLQHRVTPVVQRLTPAGRAQALLRLKPKFMSLEGPRALLWSVSTSALHTLAEWTKMNMCDSASAQLDASHGGILASSPPGPKWEIKGG